MHPYFRFARIYVVFAAVLPLLVAVLIAADGWLRARHCDQVAVLWFDRLDVSLPAFWPSGTSQRHPETLWPGIDLRFSPSLPLDPLLVVPPLSAAQRFGSGLP